MLKLQQLTITKLPLSATFRAQTRDLIRMCCSSRRSNPPEIPSIPCWQQVHRKVIHQSTANRSLRRSHRDYVTCFGLVEYGCTLVCCNHIKYLPHHRWNSQLCIHLHSLGLNYATIGTCMSKRHCHPSSSSTWSSFFHPTWLLLS